MNNKTSFNNTIFVLIVIIAVLIITLLVETDKNNKVIDDMSRNKYFVCTKSHIFTCDVPDDLKLDFYKNDTIGYYIKEDDNCNDVNHIKIYPISTNSLDGYIKKEKNKYPHNNYIKLQSPQDNIQSYKINGPIDFSTQDCITTYESLYVSYMIIEGRNSEYLIKYITDKKQKNDEILSRIKSIEINDDVEFYHDIDTKGYYKTYSNLFFSIRYPTEWGLIGKVDSITDIYIGKKDGSFGFTITRFETSRSLNSINIETKENLRKHGIKILDETEMYLCGVPCYKHTISFKNNGIEVYQESYLLKKRNTVYSIKFGNDKNRLKSSKILIREITKSLKISN